MNQVGLEGDSVAGPDGFEPVEDGGFLGAWIARALATRLKHIVSLAKSLRAHRGGLLAYYRHPISTGPLEGLNNKIKVLKRQAYGFRDSEYLKLRLAFIHESTPTFVG